MALAYSQKYVRMKSKMKLSLQGADQPSHGSTPALVFEQIALNAIVDLDQAKHPDTST